MPKHIAHDYFSNISETQRKYFLVNLACEMHGLLEEILKELQSGKDSRNGLDKLEQLNSVVGVTTGLGGTPQVEKRGPGRPRGS